MVDFDCCVQDEFARVSEQYREVSGGVTERSRMLAQVTEELESVKQEMDERGSSMTDGSKSHKDIISAVLCSKMYICSMFRSCYDFSLALHTSTRMAVLGRSSRLLCFHCNFHI
jgi:hypothetical protein